MGRKTLGWQPLIGLTSQRAAFGGKHKRGNCAPLDSSARGACASYFFFFAAVGAGQSASTNFTEATGRLVLFSVIS